MKNLVMGLIALVALSVPARADGWSENYPKALKEAKQGGKYVLLNFTGSDWCGWCKKLDAEVFNKKEFTDFAKDNLVCVTIDFPQGKSQTAEVKKQNEELSDRFKVGGYPTIVVLNPEGNPAGIVAGYQAGGPGAYVAQLKKIMDADRAMKMAKPASP